MSAIADAAAVSLEVADYAAKDASGKVNVIGGGLDLILVQPAAGLSAPFVLIVTVSVPPQFYNEECALEIILEDALGKVVELPGPMDNSQKMRVGQTVTFEEPKFPKANVPRHVMWPRTRVLLNFAAGLPLAVGQAYSWRVRIDGESKDTWVYRFAVPGPMPGPVLG